MRVAARQRRAPNRRYRRHLDHDRFGSTHREGHDQRRSLDARQSGTVYPQMLMIVVMIDGRNRRTNVRHAGHRAVRVTRVLPMMRNAVRQRFAGHGEHDDREENSGDPTRQRGAVHGGILV